MNRPRTRKPIGEWFGETIRPGESKDVELAVSESYSSMTVRIPIHIRRADLDGPTVFVTAALHGDEINGTGVIHQLIHDSEFQLERGNLILVPVLNILAFERHSRYMPDRRDLNRCFPGSAKGSLASRMAQIIFDEIVARSDFGIDLHTASIRRSNYPNVRGNMRDGAVQNLAMAFGSEIIINSVGPKGSFRRESCLAGCPTIIMEGGEIWKVEPAIVKSGLRGIKNVLRNLNMLSGDIKKPATQIVVEKTKWIRADRGGFMQFHVTLGEIVEKGQPLATNTSLLGHEQNTLFAPFDGVVIGMTTLPAISPGEPLCNLGNLPKGVKPGKIRRLRSQAPGLERQITEDLASSILTVDPGVQEESAS